MNESLEDTARRELDEETGLKDVFLEQLYTFSTPGRDPREHVITVAYYALVNLGDHKVHASSDASNAAWFCIDNIPALAFDHDEILTTAHERLRRKISYQPIGFELLPEKFPLRKLQGVYEKILDRDLDKRNFRKKILALDLLTPTGEQRRDGPHRPAKLYRVKDPADVPYR